MSESDNDFTMLVKRLESLKPDEQILVASAFSQLLNLHNLTEEIVTAQIEKAQRLGDVEMSTRSTNRSLLRMVNELKVEPKSIYDALCQQEVDLVFTAHPTQAVRSSMLVKYAKVRKIVEELHGTRMTAYERLEALDEISSQVAAAWRTDEIRRHRPSPQDESRQGLSYIRDTVYDALPIFLRRIDTALRNVGLPRLPLDVAIFRFGAWMGGDRDGNPYVTPQTTRDVVLGARLLAVTLLEERIEQLSTELSLWRASPELLERARAVEERRSHRLATFNEEARAKFEGGFPTLRMPFRVILAEVRFRLGRTRRVINHLMTHDDEHVTDALAADTDAYLDAAEVSDVLEAIYASLVATDDQDVADSTLLDVIRQVRTFGLHLVKLDIRQESTKHLAALDAVARYSEAGPFSEWEEKQRVEWLLHELKGRRPLLSPDMPREGEIKDVLDTFDMLATLPHDSLGAYIISMAHSASDVLTVALLQREAGVRRQLRVAPLFETLDDLDHAEGAMRALFSDPWYHEHIQGRQECMIGYSDSGKDAGRLAAAWGLYEVQERLAALAEEFKIRLTLFHGRGGTVGRGGAPAHLAVLSQPPNTVKGSIRVTVQGEVVEQQFGEEEIAFRTLDLYTSAVLEATLAPSSAPKPEWRAVMSELSEVSCAAYREVVREDPRFIDYFMQATPVSELGRMNIGSRPAKRRAHGSIDTLRAIPWVFAWTQVRFHLPVWLGIGTAFKKLEDEGRLGVLQEMYQEWTFFRVMLDMLEMIFAKADARVASMYEQQLVKDEAVRELGKTLRERYELTRSLTLKVMRHEGLLSSQSTALLQQKLQLRAPYVAPLNVLQIYCLKELRAIEDGTAPNDELDASKGFDDTSLALMSRSTESKPRRLNAVEDTLIITMKGIAAGMQNTG